MESANHPLNGNCMPTELIKILRVIVIVHLLSKFATDIVSLREKHMRQFIMHLSGINNNLF